MGYALAQPGEWSPPSTLIDLSPDGTPELIADLVHAFRDDASIRLGELNIALERGQLDCASRAAHSIKGAARQMGAEGVASISERIEREAAGRTSEDLIDLACGLRWVFLGECEAMMAYLQQQGCVSENGNRKLG